jgi:hypothetical protein
MKGFYKSIRSIIMFMQLKYETENGCSMIVICVII